MVTYNVFINNSVATNETLIACDSAQINGTWYFGSQNVVDNFTTGAACDSIHTVLLTINNSVSTNANLAACDSAQVNGTWYFSTQAVPNTFPANNTCDSTHIVNLTINNSSAPTIINATSCNASALGSVIDTFMNTAGCDSIVTTNTSLLAGSTGSESITACDSTQIGSTWYFNSTIFNDTLIAGASNGCDSMVTYNVFINNSVATNETLIACDSAQVNGTWYFGSQSVIDNNSTTTSCDSVYTLFLTINQNSTAVDVYTVCDSLTWIDGITYTNSTNTPTYTISGGNQNGCDIIMTLDLTIETVPNISISYSNGVLIASAGLSNYQWYRNGIAISGATNQSYTPTSWGAFTCSTNNGFCDGHSNVIVISITGINDANFEYIGIYPNPVTDFMQIDVPEVELESIKLIDVAGKVVANLDAKNREFYMGDYARGMYFIELSNANKRSIVKLILK